MAKYTCPECGVMYDLMVSKVCPVCGEDSHRRHVPVEADNRRGTPASDSSLYEDIASHREGLKDYHHELADRLERAKTGEPVGPGESHELDDIGLAHLNGKLSGLDAGLAALDELAKRYLDTDSDHTHE